MVMVLAKYFWNPLWKIVNELLFWLEWLTAESDALDQSRRSFLGQGEACDQLCKRDVTFKPHFERSHEQNSRNLSDKNLILFYNIAIKSVKSNRDKVQLASRTFVFFWKVYWHFFPCIADIFVPDNCWINITELHWKGKWDLFSKNINL